MSDQTLGKIAALIDHFDNAMLVTWRDGEMRSRPMVIGDYTTDGRIRFVTRDDSAKLAELDEHPQVNVAMQGEDRFLSISGRARTSKDRKLIESTWDSDQRSWFSDGKDDPHVTVLEVVPTYAEYWDRASSGDLVQTLLDKAGNGNGQGAAADAHGNVDLRNRPL